MLIRALQYHLGMLAGVIGLAAIVARLWKLALAALIVVLFTLVPAWWHWGPPGDAPAPSLRIMSVNLLIQNHEVQPILAEISAADPDVILLQEYGPRWHRAMQVVLGRKYPYAGHIERDDSFGMAIYSRLPLVGDVDESISLGAGEAPQMRAVVNVGGQRVTIYNLHLLPPRNLAYTVEHRRQFADLIDRLAAEDAPLIIGGDLNFTESMTQHRRLRQIGLINAHDAAGRGRGATWPVNSILRYLPGLRLDHVYVGRGATAVQSRTGVGQTSDHRPLIVDVALSGQARPQEPATQPAR
jgi:endonuclease/exonuclease/phosphatase (EEP) superfamily protein YafD